MIKNQWYGILESKEIKNKLVGVTRLGEKLVLWRNDSGEIQCISDICCHRGASLCEGEKDGDYLVCPFHGFKYDGSGRVITIPANGKNAAVPNRYRVKNFLVKEAYGFIWIWYGERAPLVEEITFFRELETGFSYSGFAETWNVHYSRAIENQLDVVHLPFVHGNSIGRGNRTLVNGPVVKWDENQMTFYVDNRADEEGLIPKKPDEILDYDSLFSLQFQMPNLWQNRISAKVRIVAVFAPIDEENTRIYIRFYQNFTKIPILKELIHFMSNYMNRYILHQDRRVVLTQLPKKSELVMDEKLIQGDLPILEYRKRRQQLKDEAKNAHNESGSEIENTRESKSMKHIAGSEEIQAVAEQINDIADRLSKDIQSFKI